MIRLAMVLASAFPAISAAVSFSSMLARLLVHLFLMRLFPAFIVVNASALLGLNYVFPDPDSRFIALVAWCTFTMGFVAVSCIYRNVGSTYFRQLFTKELEDMTRQPLHAIEALLGDERNALGLRRDARPVHLGLAVEVALEVRAKRVPGERPVRDADPHAELERGQRRARADVAAVDHSFSLPAPNSSATALA